MDSEALELEASTIEDHRFKALLRMGVGYNACVELCTYSDIEHRIQELLDRGCPLDLAVRILR